MRTTVKTTKILKESGVSTFGVLIIQNKDFFVNISKGSHLSRVHLLGLWLFRIKSTQRETMFFYLETLWACYHKHVWNQPHEDANKGLASLPDPLDLGPATMVTSVTVLPKKSLSTKFQTKVSFAWSSAVFDHKSDPSIRIENATLNISTLSTNGEMLSFIGINARGMERWLSG